MADLTTVPEEENTPDETSPERPVAGLLARFESPAALKKAAATVRDEGYRRWDVHSPFPVHGIERAMGVRRTVLPWLVLGGGITGGVVALGLQWWTNAVNYPFLISGKPFFSLPANIPVTFELIVLFAGLTAFFGNIILNRLPNFSHATFAAERFRRVTTDGFFISVDAADAKFDEKATAELLKSAGAVDVDVCRQAERAPLPSAVKWVVVTLGVLALLPPLLTAWYRAVPKRAPRFHLISDMDFQPKFKTQTADPLFADRRTMRPPVPGTVAVGGLHEDEHFYQGKADGGWARSLPMPATQELVTRGRERFDIYCAVCHGYDAAGDGMVSQRAVDRGDPDWVRPSSLYSDRVLQMADGQIFNTIANGTQNMPGYAAQISPEDRWAIVLYVRALQLSQNAKADDVPRDIREKLP